jgi:hypothetical protein
MFDLAVVAKGGRWFLVDDEAGELGDFASQAEALTAAAAIEVAIGEQVRHVLIQEGEEWEETVIEPPRFH